MIKIMVDSAADYTAEELERRGFICVPMAVTFGEEQYLDGVNLTKEDFFEKMRTSKELPVTSQPSPASFEEQFRKAKEDGDTVIAVLISGELSGTIQGAMLARELADYEDGVYIVDSKSATLGIRLLADQAAVMREQGFSAQEIVEKLEKLKGRVRIYAGLNTLDNLYKGGRLSKGAAGLGTLARIKPVITISREGKVEIHSKQIGVKHAISQLVKIMESEQPDLNYPIYFAYAGDRANAISLVQALNKKGMNIEPVKMRQIGPTIGTHIGEGAFGVVYIAEENDSH